MNEETDNRKPEAERQFAPVSLFGGWPEIARNLTIGALLMAAGLFIGLDGLRLWGFFMAINVATILMEVRK